MLLTSANAQLAAQLGFGYGGIALGIGQLAVDWTDRVEKSAILSVNTVCTGGGNVALTLADRDGDRRAGAGDVVTATLSGCYLKEFDDTFDGTVTITLAAPLASQQRAGVVSFSGFGIHNSTGKEDFTGALRFDYSVDRVAKLLHVQSAAQAFGATATDGTKSASDTVSALEIQHETRIDTVRATTAIRFHLVSNILGGSVDVATTTPWSAWFDTYPDAGEVTVSGALGSKASLRATGGDTFQILAGDQLIATKSAVGTGLFWNGNAWLPQNGAAPGYLIELASVSGFRALIQPDPAQFLPNGSLVWVYSRPLDPLSVTGATFLQTSGYGMFGQVPAKVSIEGAMLTVTPATQLALGAGYKLQFTGGLGWLRDTAGGALPTPEFSGVVAQTVSASLASPPPVLLGSAATLALDASGSSANGAAVASTRWRQLSGPPIAFSDPNAARTTISPAGAVSGIAVVELEVANAAGDVDRKLLQVTMAPDISQAFVIAYRSGNAPLAVLSNIDPASSNSYVASSQDNTVLDIMLSDGNWIRFLVGLTGQGWRPGSFTYGSGSTSGVYGPALVGCPSNSNAGSFSILDYALDSAGNVTRLALDFDDTCGDTGVATHGSIRYHSAIPMRQ